MPTIINRSSNDDVMTFRKDFDERHKNHQLKRLKAMLNMYQAIVKLQRDAKRRIKLYFHLKAIFHKLTDHKLTDPNKLRTSMFTY